MRGCLLEWLCVAGVLLCAALAPDVQYARPFDDLIVGVLIGRRLRSMRQLYLPTCSKAFAHTFGCLLT